MNNNTKYNKGSLLFAPLGGAGEIGMNCYLYHYQGKWLVVDMGIGFADHHFPGVEILVPDIKFLSDNREKIAGLVITHAHEDHVGAIPYLWDELRCPIYATKFTAAVLKAKFAETNLGRNAVVHEIEENSPFEVAPFSLEFLGLTHSIPEMQGMLIKTDKGTVFHTGDWKFDENPIIGNISNYERLKAIGDEGVLALVCDSTNIFHEGSSGSEGELKSSLSSLIGEFKNNLVVVTTFASNVARLHSIALAARECGRRVALVGRSLWRMYEAAKQSGYLDDIEPFVSEKSLKGIKREELLVICTGCQGEPLAATRKIANSIHPTIRMKKGDAIIFSSKIIPGNEKKIFHLFNKFCKLGVEVLTEQDHFVHVSGHPSLNDMKKMYELVRPQIAIPVHGEYVHLHEHAKFALKNGAKSSLEVENGNVVIIDKDGAEIVGNIPHGALAIDGNFILAHDSDILKTRGKLRDSGIIIVTLVLSHKGGLAKHPIILAPGVLDEREDSDIIEALRDEIIEQVSAQDSRNVKAVQNSIDALVKRFARNEIGKDPKVVVQAIKL
jgi:ribonuclease J